MAPPPGSALLHPSMGPDPGIVSFGPLVLDEVIFSNGRTLVNMPGGTGLYAILGARLVTPPAQSKLVGFLVVAGNDFPDHVLDEMRGWDINLIVHRELGAPSTRGRLQYHDAEFGRKTFSFTTEPLHPKPAHLVASNSNLLRAAAFHTLATPEGLENLARSLRRALEQNNVRDRSRIVWEPAPFACKSENVDAHLEACKLVHVFSPNHLEMLSLVGSANADGQSFSQHEIERAAIKFLNSGVGSGGNGAVVVRCGEHGSLVVGRGYPARWFPAFLDQAPQRVVDATGAGNAFLGGFTMGLHLSGGFTEAAVRGSVAASFVIEQLGLPTRTGSGNTERWNGDAVTARLRQYRQRIGQA